MYNTLYAHSLALLTDLYQLTMSQAYLTSGRHLDEAVFHVFFRRLPFSGGYAIAAGLAQVVEYLQQLHFDDADCAYLQSLQGQDGAALFDAEFIALLRQPRWSFDVDAVSEGTAVFAHAPLLRVKGPLWQCQLLETALLNIVNFQTLIASKAARICRAAQGEAVLEFGLRRAQGIDGSISASRAAYIGGCSATSNVLAGKLFGIPVKGTHAHSWVVAFDSEAEAFAAYAKALPNNCVFLVDTYNSIEGVKHAIAVGLTLREQGQRLLGIRLDSGDLAWLSLQAREMLDAAGLTDTYIVASNDLDEHTIESLKAQRAAINVWGVGTKLVTADGQPALGGVYKLSALRRPGQDWQYKIKLSEQLGKISIPGQLQVRRYSVNDKYIGDLIYDELNGIETPRLIDIGDPTRSKRIPATAASEDLLKPVFRQGSYVGVPESLEAIKSRVQTQLAALDNANKRLLNPHEYPVGLEPSLHTRRQSMIANARQQEST